MGDVHILYGHRRPKAQSSPLGNVRHADHFWLLALRDYTGSAAISTITGYEGILWGLCTIYAADLAIKRGLRKSSSAIRPGEEIDPLTLIHNFGNSLRLGKQKKS
jgi:hypothetical protein